MGLSLKPHHLKRYREIARLFVRYGRSDLVKKGWLEEGLEEGNGAPAAELAPKAEQLADDLEKMGPTFIKVGQFLSTRADLLPVPFLEGLTRLQDKVEAVPWEDIERIVSSELGVRISKAFESFEREPLAAASVGQVHRATLRDGTAVAVKVQRPDIRDTVVEDLDVLEGVAEFLDRHTDLGRRYGFLPMMEELRRSLLREIDYKQEARHLDRLGRTLAEFDTIVVPAPIPDYVTTRVLTMELVRGQKITSLSPVARTELNGSELADDLTRAYLHQTLVEGFFHADPHPGNVFLTDDGRIALIDVGMVSHVTPRMQDSLLKLLLAVSEGRGDDVASLAARIGEPLEDYDEAGMRRRIADLVAEFQGRTTGDWQIGRVLLEVSHIAANSGFRVPSELTMLSKTLLNLDQVAAVLDPDFDPNAAIRRHAASLLRRRMRRHLSPGRMFASALEMTELVERLPARLNRLLDAVTRNQVRVKVDAIDEDRLMVGMQKVANRITLGLVLSALIVGAALLMRVETSFRILGYPGLAILFFLGAAVGGLMLVFNILASDQKESK